MQVYSAGENFYASIQCRQINRTTQRIQEIVLSRFFFQFYIRVCGEKKDEICLTHAKKSLHSICSEIHSVCSEIHADYVSFLLKKKRFLRKECKEHSIVCRRALMIIKKIVLVVH